MIGHLKGAHHLNPLTLSRRSLVALAIVLLGGVTWLSADVPAARAEDPVVPAGFQDQLLWDGLDRPSAISFAPDGSIFVAEKSGRVLMFSGLQDDAPTLFADLTTNVHNAWDRGLLGLAVDPGYPARPYVYVFYTYDHILGSPDPAPRWGTVGETGDPCPNPPGFTADGCVVSGRLSRLTAAGGVMTGAEDVLIEDWCQQFPSHSVGQIAFGPEGALYASAGDGASFALSADYGQLGGTRPAGGPYPTPPNPCGDPPGGLGGAMTIPTAEGGSLRSQDLRTRGPGDPVGLDGSIIRIDPDTGVGWPGNANAGDADANARRIIAYGLRNPFRFTFRADGTLWAGDVGQSDWEEINVLANPNGAPPNFGWPCREGTGVNGTFASAGLDLCTSLSPSAATSPFAVWSHSGEVVSGDGCGGASGLTSSSIAGLAFQKAASPFPAPYDGALFATDYGRKCIWAYPLGTNGQPDVAQARLFADLRRPGEPAGGAVQLVVSPGGDLVYVDYDREEIRRIRWYGPTAPPVASFTATPPHGPLPHTVSFDASASTDANPDALTYAWDLDGDGAYDDGSGVTTTRTYAAAGPVDVGVRVSDPGGLFDTETQRINPGNTPPSVTITAPAQGLTWKVGDTIAFNASGTDSQDGTLGSAAYSWTFEMLHCPGDDCHSHVIEDLAETRSGSFLAPDHEYPSHLRITVTVTDSGGMTTSASRELQPITGTVSVASQPAGIQLALGGVTGAPPPPVTVIAGSSLAVDATGAVAIGEDQYTFAGWSDGGARAHDAAVPAGASTLTATYRKTGTTDVGNTCGAAASPVAPSWTWRSGRFGTTSDVDWYRFSMSSAGTLRVVLANLAVGGRLELYRGCTTLIAGVDQGGLSPEELIRTVDAGTYAVRVIGKGQSATPYALQVRKLSKSTAVLTSRTRIEGSTIRFVGEVYNPTAQTRKATVTARLYDAGGKLLATRSAVTIVSRVAPRSRAPFSISGSLPRGFARVVYAVDAPTSTLPVANPAVSITSSGPDATNHWRVAGTVTNGAARIDTLRVGVTLLDGRLDVLDAMRATTGTSVLGPRASTSFDGRAIPTALTPSRVRVVALGYR